MTTSLRLAFLQGPGGKPGFDGPLEGLESVARDAVAAGADLVLCPEMYLTGYAIGVEAVKQLAEPLDGPRMAEVRRIAREARISILACGPERSGAAIYNTATLIGSDGVPHASYRKTHLFGDVDRSQFTAGEANPPVFDFHGLRVGMLICYDVEFPEMVRALALRGADLVLVPTALMHPADIVTTAVVPTRAFENQVFVAYANRCDAEDPFDYCGQSCLVGPDGLDIARAGRGPAMMIADVDPAALLRIRAAGRHLTDRRPSFYTSLTAPKDPQS